MQALCKIQSACEIRVPEGNGTSLCQDKVMLL